MVSDATRNAVWQGYRDAASIGRYCEGMSNRFHRRYIVARFALLVSVIATVALQFASLPHPYSIFAAVVMVLVTASLAGVDLVGDFAKKGGVLHWISVEVKGLESEWATLRFSIDRADAEDAAIQGENSDLRRRLMIATRRAGESGIRINYELNEKRMGGYPTRPSTSRPAPPPPPRPRTQPQR